MLEVGDRPGTRQDIARLAQLQRHLLRGREVEAAPEDDRARAHEGRHERLDVTLTFDGPRDGLRHPAERGLKRWIGVDRLGDERQRHEACRVGLGGGHTPLLPRLETYTASLVALALISQ